MIFLGENALEGDQLADLSSKVIDVIAKLSNSLSKWF
jgi:hypothetical protein